MSLTDEQIQQTIIDGVKAGKISWLWYKKDEEDRYTIPVISKSDMQLSRTIESAATAPLLERIKQLEQAVRWESDLCQQALDSRAELEQQLEAAQELVLDQKKFRCISTGRAS